MADFKRFDLRNPITRECTLSAEAILNTEVQMRMYKKEIELLERKTSC